MKLIGFRNYYWTGDGFAAGIPSGGIPTGSVIPNVIYRTGTTPVFGVGQVSEMSVPCEFVYKGAMTYEQAWIYLMKRLLPLETQPAPLVGQLNDGTVVKTMALMTVPAAADGDVNVLPVVFVSVQPFFSGAARTTASKVFA